MQKAWKKTRETANALNSYIFAKTTIDHFIFMHRNYAWQRKWGRDEERAGGRLKETSEKKNPCANTFLWLFTKMEWKRSVRTFVNSYKVRFLFWNLFMKNAYGACLSCSRPQQSLETQQQYQFRMKRSKVFRPKKKHIDRVLFLHTLVFFQSHFEVFI